MSLSAQTRFGATAAPIPNSPRETFGIGRSSGCDGWGGYTSARRSRAAIPTAARRLQGVHGGRAGADTAVDPNRLATVTVVANGVSPQIARETESLRLSSGFQRPGRGGSTTRVVFTSYRSRPRTARIRPQRAAAQDFCRRMRRLMSTAVRPLAFATASWRLSAETKVVH